MELHLLIPLLHRTTIIFVLTAIVLFLDKPRIGTIIFVLTATILFVDKPRITRTIEQYLDTGHNFIKQNSDEFDMKKSSSKTQVTPRNRFSQRTVTSPPLRVDNFDHDDRSDIELIKINCFRSIPVIGEDASLFTFKQLQKSILKL